jgi:hypothetical protein
LRVLVEKLSRTGAEAHLPVIGVAFGLLEYALC